MTDALLPVIVHGSHEDLYDSGLIFCELPESRQDTIHRISLELLVGTDREFVGFLELHDLSSHDRSPFEDIHLLSLFDECIWIESKYLLLHEHLGSLRDDKVEVYLLTMCDIFE